MRNCLCLLALSVVLIFGLFNATGAGGPVPTAYDTVVADFIKGPFGAVVAIGDDKKSAPIGLRIGAAATIGVSPDSYDKYRFAIYVEARNEEGKIVVQHAAVMADPFKKGDSHKTGAYIDDKKAKPGTYTITAVLTAIARDGSVTVLDQGKSNTVVIK